MMLNYIASNFFKQVLRLGAGIKINRLDGNLVLSAINKILSDNTYKENAKNIAESSKRVKWFGNTSWFKKLWKKRRDKMVSLLKSKGIEAAPYKDR